MNGNKKNTHANIPYSNTDYVVLPCTQTHILFVRVWNVPRVFPRPARLWLFACVSVHLRWHHTTRLILFPATLPGRACWDGAAITPSCHIRTGPLPLCHSPRFAEWSRSMRAFMSSGPCHGFSYEFISQAGVQGMFNLAPGSNHLTEVEVMATCFYTAHLKEVCGL